MRCVSTVYLAAAIIADSALVLADTHFFYMGYFSEEYISGVEFDDNANTLSLVNNFSVTSGSSRWIAPDAQLQNLYVAGDGIYQSYTINSDKSLTPTGANVSDTASCTKGVSLAVQHTAPYTVFGVAYDAGCSGVVMSVDASGALAAHTANLTYDTAAGVHGLAIAPDDRFVYSADDMGSRVWAHSASNSTAATATQHLGAAGARHLVVHPGGRWLYVVFESANEVAVFGRDADTGELVSADTTYSLLPDGFANSSSYWSSDVAVSNATSASPRYLLAFARSRSTGVNGWVSGFALDAETGAITERVFIEEASGTGGTTNAVVPATFSEEYFAVTDQGADFVEVWQIADNGTSASAVAHLDLESGPVNVVWSS